MKINSMVFTTLIYSAISIITVSCGGNKNAESQKRGASQQQVDALIVVPQLFENNITANANLLAFEETKIDAPISGNVLSINFKEGQNVNKGELLVQLDDRKWQAQLKGLQSKLAITKSDLQRKTQLFKAEGATKEDVELAESAIQQLDAQIEDLSVSITLAAIRAPYSGRVGLRDFSLGAYLSQGQLITNLVQSNKLKVDFSLQTRYLGNIKQGSTIKVVLTNDTINAEIYAIDPGADMSSRTTSIRAIINNSQNKYVPGGYAQVVVSIDANSSALIVPTNVIIPDLNAQTVFVLKNGKAFRKEVVLGIQTEKWVQINSGINPLDTILSTGLLNLQNGIPVKVKSIKRTTEL